MAILSFNNIPTTNPLWDGLLAYYTADNTPNDSKGTNNGVLMNGATYGTGVINQGFSFDGVNDYFNVSSNIGLTGDFSISLWFNFLTLSGFSPLFQSVNFITLSKETLSLYLSNDKLIFQMKGLNNTFYSQTSSTSFSTSTLYNVQISYNNTTKKADFYIDGVKDSISQDTIYLTCTSTDINNGFDLGRRRTNAFADGIIDEIGIWGRTLTSTEITELYNSGTGKQYPN
jgi:hypothetical protein